MHLGKAVSGGEEPRQSGTSALMLAFLIAGIGSVSRG
jgi:hypothetical protein